MSELIALGYPDGYHMGLSAIIWWIAIVVIAILGVILYLNARKSNLINVKEMLISKAIVYICGVSIHYVLIQVGVFYPNYFLQLYTFGAILSSFFTALYYYYWEKNLTRIKRIPTFSAIAAAILTFMGFVMSIWFPDFALALLDFLGFLVILLEITASILYLYLIYNFSKNVKGINKTVGIIWMAGMILNMIGTGFEHPPGATILPSFMVLYMAPLMVVIGLSLAVYGIIMLFAQISSYYAQTQKCAVHRGVIEKGKTVYYCPSCGITYCETCFNQVIKKDGCWNCWHGAEIEREEEWKVESVLNVKKADNHKHKIPK